MEINKALLSPLFGLFQSHTSSNLQYPFPYSRFTLSSRIIRDLTMANNLKQKLRRQLQRLALE